MVPSKSKIRVLDITDYILERLFVFGARSSAFGKAGGIFLENTGEGIFKVDVEEIGDSNQGKESVAELRGHFCPRGE